MEQDGCKGKSNQPGLQGGVDLGSNLLSIPCPSSHRSYWQWEGESFASDNDVAVLDQMEL